MKKSGELLKGRKKLAKCGREKGEGVFMGVSMSKV